MLSCIIIDDEPLARDVLADFVGRSSDMTLLGRFSNAFEARAFLSLNPVDTVFLDIEMPEMSGIDLLKSLTHPPVTVFTTAFRDYAFEGFELGVIDFLLKPFSYERFRLATDRVKEFLSLRADEASLDEKETHPEYIFVKSGVNRIRLSLAEVTHIQGLKDYAIIHTPERKVVVKGSVKSVHQLFPQEKFIRTHKSFIVAKDKVRRIERNKIIIGQNEIPIGRNYRTEVEQKITRV